MPRNDRFASRQHPGAISDCRQFLLSARWRYAIQRQQSGPSGAGRQSGWGDNAVILSRSFGEGLLARMMKDEARANAAFRQGSLEQEKIVQAQPGYGPALCVLGLIDAALGRKEEALSEGRRAIELLPVEKDSSDAVRCLSISPIIAALGGEKDTALQYLAANVNHPADTSLRPTGRTKSCSSSGPTSRRSALRANRRFARSEKNLNAAVVVAMSTRSSTSAWSG